jgi:hypothetical protein
MIEAVYSQGISFLVSDKYCIPALLRRSGLFVSGTRNSLSSVLALDCTRLLKMEQVLRFLLDQFRCTHSGSGIVW